MKAFNSIKYFLSAAIVAMTLGACTEELPEYVKAEVPEGAQAFFAGVPSSFDLTDGDGSIEVAVMRGNTAGEVTVGLTSEADELFTVPTSVKFAADAKEATISITYDPAAIVADTPYSFTLKLADNTTPYGAASCSFTAGAIAPQLWTDFAMATFTEGFWGEEHKHMIKYREEGNVRYCVVLAEETCDYVYSDGSTCPGGVWGTAVDFEFIWYTDKLDANGNQLIEVPAQYMGWDYQPSVPVYLYDIYHLYKDNLQDPSVVDMTFDDYIAAYPDDPMCYYDGNGGFFFNLNYMVPSLGAGQGFASDAYDVVAICDGFERKLNYNTAFEYSALYEADAASMMFSEDGTTPLEFPTTVRYNEEVKDSLAVEYYLPDYFKAGNGLAFKAPAIEKLEEGAKIVDVDNEQFTGIVMFGNEVYVNVKGGTVTFAEGSEFPTFTVKVAVYTLDEEGNKTFDFGQFEEVISAYAYGKDFYTVDDLVGLQKASFCGNFLMTAYDMDGVPFEAPLLIQDAGTDADGHEWVKISNLSGYYGNNGWDDSILAEWYNGLLYIYDESPCATPFAGYNLSAVTVDPETGDMPGKPLLAGYVEEEGVIAIVGSPGYDSCRGLYFVDFAQGTALTLNYDYVLYPLGTGEASVKSKAPAKRAPMMSAIKPAEKAARTINSSNAAPYVKPAKDFTIVKHGRNF